MAHPFPDRPITAERVKNTVAPGGWTPSTCPLCGCGGSASWPIDGFAQVRWICPYCQAFILTHPAEIWLATLLEPKAAAVKAALSHAAAQAEDALLINLECTEAVASKR